MTRPAGRHAAPAAAARPCECGHPREAHGHYRKGTECALCDCPVFCPARPGRHGRDSRREGAGA